MHQSGCREGWLVVSISSTPTSCTRLLRAHSTSHRNSAGLHTPHRPLWALPASHRNYGSLHPAGLCILHWALQAPPAAWSLHPTLGPAGSPYVTQKPCRSPYPTLGPEGSPCCTHGLHTPYRALWVCPASYRNPTGVHTPHQALPHTRTLHPSQALWAHPAAHTNSAPQTGPCGLALPHTRTPCSSLHLHGEDLVSMKQYLTKTTCRGLPSCWAGGNTRS